MRDGGEDEGKMQAREVSRYTFKASRHIGMRARRRVSVAAPVISRNGSILRVPDP